ncbi:MAG TPA: hypothetical protein VF254_06150 [Gammaproteobacteria bacterium]
MRENTFENKLLPLLAAHPEGLSSPEIRARLRPRVSQPTLSRRLLDLRARGLVVQAGAARATRYLLAGGRLRTAALRSQALHRVVAARLIREPALRQAALQRLEKLRAANPGGKPYHDRWEQLLRGEETELLRVMTESGETAETLRKESPFTTFIGEKERERIFRQFSTGGRATWTASISGFSSKESRKKPGGNTSSS